MILVSQERSAEYRHLCPDVRHGRREATELGRVRIQAQDREDSQA